jgi:predicted nuclease of predicted toxin-antitoxin system
VRFFVDENLSPTPTPTPAAVCRDAGHDATSVRDRGMLNATDREVSALCFDEERILATNNAADFLALAERDGPHPGLVFIPLGSGAEMRTSMRTAIAEIERCELFEHP